MDYYKMQNIESDTDMRKAIAKPKDNKLTKRDM